MRNDRATLTRFGKNLRALREKKNLTQEDLAALAGFDRTYVSLVERGRRNIALLNICRFAKALDTSPAELTKAV